jgi:hypothetical protein
MAPQNVAEVVVAVVDLLVLLAVVVALLLRLEPLACDQMVFQFQDLAHEGDLQLASLALPRPIVHAWSRRSLTGRSWDRWHKCQVIMEVWLNWLVLQIWETHLWFSISEGARKDPLDV